LKVKKIVKFRRKYYNSVTRKEEGLVTDIIKRIERIELSPQHRESLGLSKDWNKKVSREFVGKVIKAADKYKPAIKELEKY
jgi:hypothetical protein